MTFYLNLFNIQKGLRKHPHSPDVEEAPMARPSEKPILTKEEEAILRNRSRSQTEGYRDVVRAKIVLMSAEGVSDVEIAKDLSLSPTTVRTWRLRFLSDRIEGLNDRPRSGRPPLHDKEKLCKDILALLETPPPNGQSTWDGNAIALTLGIAVWLVWLLLRMMGVKLNKLRTYCVSKDPLFDEKSADVIRLYLFPPENSVVLCVDEKTSIQALFRPRGYVKWGRNGFCIGQRSTYGRNGITNLFCSYNSMKGGTFERYKPRKRRIEFLEFLDEVVAQYPADKQIHIIMDNYCVHKKCDEWLRAHPNVTFHYTPTSASWLNLVEVYFGILTRKVLRGGSFQSVEELEEAMKEFSKKYNENPKPFVWTKAEVKGGQLRNSLRNLRKFTPQG